MVQCFCVADGDDKKQVSKCVVYRTARATDLGMEQHVTKARMKQYQWLLDVLSDCDIFSTNANACDLSLTKPWT